MVEDEAVVADPALVLPVPLPTDTHDVVAALTGAAPRIGST